MTAKYTFGAFALAAALPLIAFEIAPHIVPQGETATVEIRAVNDAEKKMIAETPSS